ncbi:rod shape-determining protein [bacterium]|nr:rod shape-determining protein [bacterium]
MIFPLRMGLDLGTSRVRINVKGQGIVLDEPAVVAYYRNEGKVLAVGLKALDMLGKTPAHIQAASPIRHGVIINLPMAEAMLRYFLRQAGILFSPKLVISVPANITNVARRAVREATLAAGASKVWLIEAPTAASLGASIDMSTPIGMMVVDIGSGTTDLAVLSAGQTIISDSVRIAGNQCNLAIQDMMRYNHSLLISDRLAEEIKISLGTAVSPKKVKEMEVKGSDVVNGLPRTQIITNQEIYQALQEPLQGILSSVKSLLAQTTPALAGDLVSSGIVLTGGGAQLGEIDIYLQSQLQIPVRVAENPQHCVALGTLKADIDTLSSES